MQGRNGARERTCTQTTSVRASLNAQRSPFSARRHRRHRTSGLGSSSVYSIGLRVWCGGAQRGGKGRECARCSAAAACGGERRRRGCATWRAAEPAGTTAPSSFHCSSRLAAQQRQCRSVRCFAQSLGSQRRSARTHAAQSTRRPPAAAPGARLSSETTHALTKHHHHRRTCWPTAGCKRKNGRAIERGSPASGALEKLTGV